MSSSSLRHLKLQSELFVHPATLSEHYPSSTQTVVGRFFLGVYELASGLSVSAWWRIRGFQLLSPHKLLPHPACGLWHYSLAPNFTQVDCESNKYQESGFHRCLLENYFRTIPSSACSSYAYQDYQVVRNIKKS